MNKTKELLKVLLALWIVALTSASWADLVNTASVRFLNPLGVSQSNLSNTVVIQTSVAPPVVLPTPILKFPNYVSVDGTLTVGYPSWNTSVGFIWTFTATSIEPVSGAQPTGSVRSAAGFSANFTTAGSAANLKNHPLVPGIYTVSVQAFDSLGNTSPLASQGVTLVATDLDSTRVFPNPWRSDRHSLVSITFDHLPLGAEIKLFTVSGHSVKTFKATTDTITWDLSNESGDRVASGVYLYVIAIGETRVRGKIVVIR